jgi:hypothetical protein
MPELFVLIAHLLVTLAKLARRGGLRSGGRIIGGQTPVAHHEACAAPYSESDLSVANC